MAGRSIERHCPDCQPLTDCPVVCSRPAPAVVLKVLLCSALVGMAALRVLVGSLWFLALLRSGAAAGVVGVDGRRAIAATGEYFVCATLDWWPPDKCDYGTCSWGRAGLLNLVTASSSSPSTDSCSVSSQISRPIDTIFFTTQDLSNKILLNAVRGRRRRSFSPDILAGAAASSSTDPLPMLRISFCFLSQRSRR